MSIVIHGDPVVPKVGAPVFRHFFAGLCGLVLCVIGANQLFGIVTRKDRSLRDFVQEWTSARNWRLDRPVYQDLREAIPFHFPGAIPGDIRVNAHPPVAVVLALPFGSWRYQRALQVWNLLSLACVMVATGWLTGKRGFDLTLGQRLSVTGLVLNSAVLKSELIQGQLNGILYLLLVGAWQFARRERVVASGVMVGLAASLKLFPGLLVLFFLARRQWKGCLAVLATWLIANLAAASILGVDAFRDYVQVVMPDVSRFVDTWPNASLLGFLSRLFDGSFGQVTPLVRWPLLAKVLWVMLSLFLTGFAVRATSRGAETDSAFSLWLSLMLLVSPVAWDHYFLMAVLPLTALWQSRDRHSNQRGLFLTAAVALLIVFPPYKVWHWLVPGYTQHGMSALVAQPSALLMGISFQFYASLAVFGSCLQDCLTRIPSSQDGANAQPDM